MSEDTQLSTDRTQARAIKLLLTGLNLQPLWSLFSNTDQLIFENNIQEALGSVLGFPQSLPGKKLRGI